jgi:hypothetical protein
MRVIIIIVIIVDIIVVFVAWILLVILFIFIIVIIVNVVYAVKLIYNSLFLLTQIGLLPLDIQSTVHRDIFWK